ncbi:putative colanic acid biosynthesis acetyltransferase [Mucilaginibacter sp. SP1R1]|uniref:putative colanic acid biosynthesis acetyltransferase n=1 Tax=Mucilaginibacter sp. SP1R1 TaxID=2723091 RepID=UPI00160D9911|nr:putative colanic acid biosynthesis acetyltransferase [Mucilaginibacter sp. SP1R1]MBB6149058.1 putative colanic acid biosynthesis acetyltransferase WcaF [Mucilaginibacter sp. SP1R1]
MFSVHDKLSEDGYLRPVFSFSNKLKRFCWNITWLLLCRWTPNPMHKWRVMIVRLFGGKIGKQNTIYPDCKIWAPWLLVTEDVVTIGPAVEVYNPGGVYLSHHAVLSQNSFLCGATHDYNTSDFTYIMKEIVIQPYVWICSKAVVLPGVNCMEGSVLGAAAVTSRDLKPWTVYGGNPAVALKTRTDFLNK